MWQLFKDDDVINDTYVVRGTIGRGGMGTVLKIQSKDDGEHYALKYCVGDREDLERFRREVGIVEGIEHHNVIKVVDSELRHSPPYFVMPLAEGSLEDKIATFRGDETRLLAVFKDICTGVLAVHKAGYYHRDLKPSNVLIIHGTITVSDFGLAKIEAGKTTGLTQSAMGTLEYAAPEQLSTQGTKRADARTDIYQLGKVLYWMYTGGNRLPPGLSQNRPSESRGTVPTSGDLGRG